MTDKELRKILSIAGGIADAAAEPLNIQANIEQILNKAILIREKQPQKSVKFKKQIRNLNFFGRLALAAATLIFTVTGAIYGVKALGGNPAFVKNIGQAGSVRYAGGYGTIELTATGKGNPQVLPQFVILYDGQLDGICIWLPEGTATENWDFYKNKIIESSSNADIPGWLKNSKDKNFSRFFYGDEILVGKNPKFTYSVSKDESGTWRIVKSQGKIEGVIWMPGVEQEQALTPPDDQKSEDENDHEFISNREIFYCKNAKSMLLGPARPEFVILVGVQNQTLCVWLPEVASAEKVEFYKNVVFDTVDASDIPGWFNNNFSVSFFDWEEEIVGNGHTKYFIEFREDGWNLVISGNNNIIDLVVWSILVDKV